MIKFLFHCETQHKPKDHGVLNTEIIENEWRVSKVKCLCGCDKEFHVRHNSKVPDYWSQIVKPPANVLN